MKIGKLRQNESSAWKTVCAVFLFCAVATIGSSAQTFTSIHSFDGNDGALPNGGVVQGMDGNFYGMTALGGTYQAGTIYKMALAGDVTQLYTFCTSKTGCYGDGISPIGNLVQEPNGSFYGTASKGGLAYAGTVFSVDPLGNFTLLYSFCTNNNCVSGANPNSDMTPGVNGDLYGTASAGGTHGDGTLFMTTLSGKVITLHEFDYTDGAFPGSALVLAPNGKFYGAAGGAGGAGTIYEWAPSGKFTLLYSFCSQTNCTDGFAPQGLVAANGSLYGTTYADGAYGGGTFFKLSPAGKLTTLHSFQTAEGTHPGAIIQATDGNFYGTTSAGGNGYGTIVKMDPSGKVTVLHSFNNTDGWQPVGLMQSTNGSFYGTTASGGSNICSGSGCGTVFKLSTGLAPFVTFLQNFGKIGATVQILGQGLTGTSSVSFNGTPANFTVVSDTLLQVTVPLGATSGNATVATPTGTLTSNKNFHVLP
jgi:uncharacterized repeat protein (TIGR03803 family)